MKKILIIIACLISFTAHSQNVVMRYVDKLSLTNETNGARVNVTFDQASQAAVSQMVASPRVYGCRILIFSDNSQSARGNGSATLAQFQKMYPNISAEMTYQTPLYKVQVGNFLNRAEANRMLSLISGTFTKASVVNNVEMPISLFITQKPLLHGASEIPEGSR